MQCDVLPSRIEDFRGVNKEKKGEYYWLNEVYCLCYITI